MNILLLCLLKSKSAIQTQLNGRTWIAYLHNDVNISVSVCNKFSGQWNIIGVSSQV